MTAQRVAAVVAATARAGDGHPVLPPKAVFAIAALANGLGPWSLVDTQWHGVYLNALRGGPLDKKGAGSGILDARGAVDAKEVSRLRGFAKAKPDGRYLGLQDVIDLFKNRRFPERMNKRLRHGL